ncbi:hypothetical protein IJ750_02655 [bacterium]|nr:hypothetical protein [bacterium]
MYERIDYEDNNERIEEYDNKDDVTKDATRFYHEHFYQDEDYDEDFEVKTFEQALDFWDANGYEIRIKHEEGVCPACGSQNITYDGSEIDGNSMYYKCICDDCDTTFNECYNLVFVEHNNIIS